ncbi:hypothetical protein SAMN05216436_112111 [bacterium A37T11]|nr:hypothetical protein SAMN05216436_112111 [bacterium A37T11]
MTEHNSNGLLFIKAKVVNFNGIGKGQGRCILIYRKQLDIMLVFL